MNGGIHRDSAPAASCVAATALMALGLIMVASTSFASLGEQPQDFLRTPFGRQCVFVGFGLTAMAIAAIAARTVFSSEVRSIRCSWFAFAVVAAALSIMLIPGVTEARRGSYRWLSLTVFGLPLGVQPSEFAKLAMVGGLCAVLGRKGADPRSLRGSFLPSTAIIAVTVGLVGKEDFGTCALLSAVGGVLLFIAGCRYRYLVAVAAVGLIGLIGLVLAEPYRLDRITAFRDIWADPRGGGYQPVQSLTAIATGGWFGTGLGSGIQKYGYLPESHTDFIFAMICEEMGVLGGLLVLGLFGVFVFLGWRAAMHARTEFERLLAAGITVTVGLQVAMNVAVVTVLTPTTGISLPFVSAGGSGVVVFSIATGLLVAIESRAYRLEDAAPGESAEVATPRLATTDVTPGGSVRVGAVC